MTQFLKGLFRKAPAPARRGRDYLAEELERRRRRAAATGTAASSSVDRETRAAGTEAPLARREPAEMAVYGTNVVDVTSFSSDVPDEIRRGIDPTVLRVLTPQLAHEFGVLPLRFEGSTIVLATARQPTYKLQNEIRWLIGLTSDRPRTPVFHCIDEALMAQCLDIYYPFTQQQAILPPDNDLMHMFARGERDAQAVDVLRPAGAPQATVRNLVNGVLMKAAYRGANDILFECFETEFRVRFKVEGSCEYAMTPLPPSAAPQVVSVIKQHARLDIAETEKCQDGRFDMKIECKGEIKSIQFRVAIRPTINGESCVVRLHDNSERRPRLESLGADRRSLEAFWHVRDHRGGLVLLSGPTGSGKTTTLAAILGACDSVRENIVTIEDPVEIRLPGVTQSAVNELKGETFGRLLRNALRVAPDRILVGEVRDAETAHLVIKASLTGHQVLSTVHADDAPRAVTRILEEGVSPFNLSSVLFLVVAQRLLNRLCEHCAYDVTYPFEILDREQFSPAEFGAVRAREARGCTMCHNRGTHGRIAIYETLVLTDAIRDTIARRPNDLESRVRRHAIADGMRPLRRSGLDLVRRGLVSLHQVADATPYIPVDALVDVWSAAAREPFDEPAAEEPAAAAPYDYDLLRTLVDEAEANARPAFSVELGDTDTFFSGGTQ